MQAYLLARVALLTPFQQPVTCLLQELLQLENPELFKWITGQEKAPTDLQHNLALKVSKLPTLPNYIQRLLDEQDISRTSSVCKCISDFQVYDWIPIAG